MDGCSNNSKPPRLKAPAILFVLLFILTTTLFFFPIKAIASQSAWEKAVTSRTYFTSITPIASATLDPPSSNQADQKLAEGQNDINIANSIIAWSGIILAVLFGVITVAGILSGFLGVREFSAIRKSRLRLEARIRSVTALENQLQEQLQTVKEHIKQLEKDFENDREMVKGKLEQLTNDFKIESQVFMDASYYFTLGTNAYKIGDNIHAIEYYAEALRLQPDNARTLERLGRAYSNLNDLPKSIEYLEHALKIDPKNVPALRSLALCYRYHDQKKCAEYLEQALEINSLGYEAWDFLGLVYRDQGLFDQALKAHERALEIKKRPETYFYLSILYAYNGDRKGAKIRALIADDEKDKQEHDQRIRPVWKILIHIVARILDSGTREEVLELILTLTPYITTRRICDGVTSHLCILLEATDNKDWIPEFLDLVKLKDPINATS